MQVDDCIRSDKQIRDQKKAKQTSHWLNCCVGGAWENKYLIGQITVLEVINQPEARKKQNKHIIGYISVLEVGG